MYKLLWLPFVFFAILTFLYIPELFHLCTCCKRKKFRLLIRIHKAVSISPGYKGCRSVCKKCCRKYNLNTFDDLQHFISVSKKIRIEHLTKGI